MAWKSNITIPDKGKVKIVLLTREFDPGSG